MITKIKKIKNLGIFSDYSWDQNLPIFQRYNLIYGWNRTGKTTLSNLFFALEAGSLAEYQNLEYEVETDTGIFRQGLALDRKVRVFNSNYVSRNIQLLEGKAHSISLILGEENKTALLQIQQDEKMLNGDPSAPNNPGKIKDLSTQRDLKERKEKEKAQKFTDIAKIIGENTSGVTPRNYRKPDAENSYKLLKVKELLNDEDKKKYLISIREDEKPTIEDLAIPKFKLKGQNDIDALQALQEAFVSAKSLCATTVESIIIERLKSNLDIQKWVEAGLSLHKKYQSKNCEFCDQILPKDRITHLDDFFNEADQKLKNEIDTQMNGLKGISNLIESVIAVDKVHLYKELQDQYQLASQEYENEKNTLLKQVAELEDALGEKKSKTTEKMGLEIEIITSSVASKLEILNQSITKHNGKTADFKTAKNEAQKKLEKHYLSTIYDEVKEIEKEIEEIKRKEKILEDGDPGNTDCLGITALKARIAENQASISSSHKGCEKINDKLKTFLGNSEIVFEVAEAEGYLIKRNGQIASRLSEGEKTAIAFIYFIIHLQDQNFDSKEGVIVIDDPVSSLDSNSMFQAFSFLKNAVKDAHQVFLFTHNFDFLRLLLNWLHHSGGGPKTYLMIKNNYSNTGDRMAEIDVMDPELKTYETEYHYLFKLLLEFKTDGTIASVYHIPNIARKVLDYFLMFQVPNSETMFKKVERLQFDEDKKTAIYKFVNDQSHITGKGFDPSLVPETQKNVQYLLEMIESVFPEHYKILKESVQRK